MRFALAALFLAAAAPAHAQNGAPHDRFAGQTLDGTVCEPAGSTSTMSVCFVLWRDHEEALLQQSLERLLAYAREQEATSPIFAGSTGYVAAIESAQGGWLDWRNRECSLMTLDDVGGSIRRITYPNCQASLTAQRRRQLDAVLAFWRAEFRDARGEASGVQCVLEPTAFRNCGEPQPD